MSRPSPAVSVAAPPPPSPSSSSSGFSPATLGWLLILGGCCANVLSLEVITNRDKGAGSLITFAQFLFIAAEGAFQQYDFSAGRFTRRVVPLLTYLLLVTFFFSASILNNLALNFNISMPVHTVFRSSGLAGTIITGYLFFGKRYTTHQVLTCLLVTVGVTSLTFADANVPKVATAGCCGDPAKLLDETQATETIVATIINNVTDTITTTNQANSTSFISELFSSSLLVPFLSLFPLLSSSFSSLSLSLDLDLRWLIGISMLTATLTLLAILGHLQERTYAVNGKVWKELLFYQHLISLPCFLLFASDISTHFIQWFDPATHTIINLPNGTSISVSLFIMLFINLFTQWVCVKGVAILTCHTSALTCTLALTSRKFLSLLLSILSFRNEFTAQHWVGSVLVFVGIIAYANPKWFAMNATTTQGEGKKEITDTTKTEKISTTDNVDTPSSAAATDDDSSVRRRKAASTPNSKKKNSN